MLPPERRPLRTPPTDRPGGTLPGIEPRPERHYSAAEWQHLWTPLGIDGLLITRLGEILNAKGTVLSGEEHMQAAYYQYSIAMGSRGIHLLDNPHLSRVQRDDDRESYDLGARMTASAYLREYPDHVVPQTILEQGIAASPVVHTLFFHMIIDTMIMPFYYRHDPAFAASDAPDAPKNSG